jgi:hypothetical protein
MVSPASTPYKEIAVTTKFFLRRARSGLRTTTANKLIATIAVLGAAASIAGLATFATFTSDILEGRRVHP